MDVYKSKYKEYPKELFEGRMDAEALLIGCLMKDMLLLDDVKINKDSFVTKDGAFYFEIISRLRSKNINVLTEIDIIANFQDSIINAYNDRGGMNQINRMISTVDSMNFYSYLDTFNKHVYITALYEKGYNLFKEIEYNGKTIIPIKFFKKLDSQGVLEFYEAQLNSLNIGSNYRGTEELEMDITDEFIEGCYSGINTGVPIDDAGLDINGEKIYGFPKISNQIQGFLPKTLSMLGGYSSVGKSTMSISMIMALINRGERIFVISNEQDKEPFMMNFLMWVLTNKLRYYKLSKKNLLSGNVTDYDKEMIKKAKDIWRNEYKGTVFFMSIPTADIKLIKKKIREYALTKGITTFFYDTFKADFTPDRGDNTWIELIRDSRELHEIAKKYNLIGITSIQLAMHTLGTLFLTPNVLSQSKQVVEILENLLLMRNVYHEELDPEDGRYYCNPYRHVKGEDGKWRDEPIEIDINKQYRMLFISKCRNGENSQSGNYAILLSFDGAHGGFREYSFCRPKNAFINRG